MLLLSMTKILITGGTGFIGSNIATELVNQGYNVSVLDNLSTGNVSNISGLNIEFLKGDIRDFEFVKKSVKDVDYILHQAALPSVFRSIKDPLTVNDVNTKGTLNILVVARDNNVKRVVYASSSSVYGDTPILPKKEDMIPKPLSPYAVSKLVGEYYCKVFYNVYGLETVSLRYFNVFGPRQNPKSEYAAVIPKFINFMLENKSPVIYGDGTQTRDFTFVKNVVEANILALKAKNAAGNVLNIACENSTSVNELVDKINELLDRDISPDYTKLRLGDIKNSLADISLAKKILGYEPKYSFEEGLKETINWFKRLEK